MIDTHAHLDLITHDSEIIEQILQKCKNEQITSIFNISVDYESNFKAQELAKEHKEIYFSIGLHPSQADNYNMEQIDDLTRLISHKKCIGIGEIGIDLFKMYSKTKNQKKLFEIFLNIAKENNKPVIIHSRDAFKEICEFIQKNEYKGLKGVFHCFSYGYEEAVKCIDMGYMISFAGNLTYKNAHNLHETAKKIPLEYIMIETDSPFLSPEPKRGKKNFPYYLGYTLKFLSKLKNRSIDDIISIQKKSIKNLFAIQELL